MNVNNQLNKLSQIQDDNKSVSSQSQMSLLNELNNGSNSLDQSQLSNSSDLFPINNFQNNLHRMIINNANNNANNWPFNNNPLFMNNSLEQQKMNNNKNHIITLRILTPIGINIKINISPFAKVSELYKIIEKEYPQFKNIFFLNCGKLLIEEKTLISQKINNNNNTILLLAGLLDEDVDVDASIIVINDNHPKFNINNLFGLMRLCLLKENSKKIKNNFENKYSDKLPERIRYIMDILIYKNIPVGFNKTINSIMGVLKKLKGENIINIAKFIEDYLNKSDLNVLINLLEDEVKENAFKLINCLGIYNDYAKLFEIEFDKVKKNSLFDYSIVSLTIVDRKDIEKFEKEKKNCENRKERILFHGTSIKSSGAILTDMFKRSEKAHYQFGKGVYFTDMLDYCWYYGGPNSNRENLNKIPKVGEKFTSVVSLIYYNQNGFKRVYDHKKDPEKNEINFALVDGRTKTILEDILIKKIL